MLFPLTLALGVVLGWVAGGSFRSLATLQLRLPGLIVVSFVLQLAIDGAGVGSKLAFPTLLASYALLGIWLAVNLWESIGWRRAGFGALAVGYALNLVAIAPNGSMPVSMAALGAVGGTEAAFAETPNVAKHVAAGTDAAFLLLGDVIPVPALGAVVSAGDIAMLLGVVVLMSVGMKALDPRAQHARGIRGRDTRPDVSRASSELARHPPSYLVDVQATEAPVPPEGDEARDQSLGGPPTDGLGRNMEEARHLAGGEVLAVADVMHAASQGQPA